MTEINYKNDLLNRKFGRLIPIKRISRNRRSYWICNCDCGNQTTVRRDGLLSGRIVSCGCYNKERAKKVIITENTESKVQGYIGYGKQ